MGVVLSMQEVVQCVGDLHLHIFGGEVLLIGALGLFV